MITQESRINIIDNSGAKKILCIKVYKRKWGFPGDLVIGTVKKAVKKKFKKKKKVIKSGELHKALLCVTRFGPSRVEGYTLRGPFSAAVILRKERSFVPFANRIIFPVCFELRNVCARIALIAPNVF